MNTSPRPATTSWLSPHFQVTLALCYSIAFISLYYLLDYTSKFIAVKLTMDITISFHKLLTIQESAIASFVHHLCQGYTLWALSWLFVKKIFGEPSLNHYLALHPVHLREIALSITLVLWSILAMQGMIYLAARIPQCPAQEHAPLAFYKQQGLDNPYLIVTMACLGPLIEEVLFRGVLFRIIQKSPLGSKSAIYSTALLFGFFHAGWGGYEVLVACLIGLVYGYVRYRYDTLLLPMLMHVVHNIFAWMDMYIQR